MQTLSGAFVLNFFLVFISLAHWTLAIYEDPTLIEEDLSKQVLFHLLSPKSSTGITAPGTKWCGPGRTAAHYDDLGTSIEADICCRAHDHCPEIIKSHTSLHGLENPDLFPRLLCSCERAFMTCLKRANTPTADTIGRLYYGARKFCFAKGHPILECEEYQLGIIRTRCLRYEVDEKKPIKWQFYEMPFFKVDDETFKRTMKENQWKYDNVSNNIS